MNSKQRVEKALKHQKPDRVPTFFRRHYVKGYELPEDVMNYIENIIDIGPYLNMKEPDGFQPKIKDGIYYDELGIGRRFTGLYWDIVDFPLASMNHPDELDEYPWPYLRDPSRVAHLKDEAQKIIKKARL